MQLLQVILQTLMTEVEEIRAGEEGNRLRRKSSHVPAILGVQTIDETEERKCDANHCFQYPPT